MVVAEPANPTLEEEVDDAGDVKVDDDFDSDEEIPFEYSIMSYGADYTVDSLVKRVEQGSIFVPPFQRGYVWDKKRASKFVESLLLGLPVPGIFLSREESTNKSMIVDGQQRLESLRSFYNGKFGDAEFNLTGIASKFKGKTYASLDIAHRLKLDDSIIHATIVRQDKPSDDNSSIYMLFERLNTDGLQLQPQEIRVAMFHGEFNNLIGRLNQEDYWRDMFGKVHNRMKDQELILRFLAMYFIKLENYRVPLKRFLNEYMSKNRRLTMQSEEEVRCVFENTMRTIHDHLGVKAFKPPQSNGRFTAAVFDSVAVGIATRLERGDIQDSGALKSKYESLMKDEDYRKATYESTARTAQVKQRLGLAIKAFAPVP